MNEKLCFAGENVSQKEDGKLVRGTVARRSRLCSDHGRIGPLLELRVQASFSHFELSKFEGCLARKLRFHIFHFHILREILNESFVFISSAFTCGGKSRMKASFSYLQLSLSEGSLARNAFVRDSGWSKLA